MSFSSEWDQVYRRSDHLSIWPWTDVVSYVHRYAKPKLPAGQHRVLELGCGAGANIPFFLRLGVDYCSVEGSDAIVSKLKQTYPELAGKLKAGDFTQELPFEGNFDLIFDRVSLAHNSTAAIERCLALVYDKLHQGGVFMGFDWFSTEHEDAVRGLEVDSHTRTELPATSHLTGLGRVHFFDQAHLVDLLKGAGFVIERLEHKRNEVRYPAGGPQLAWWNFVVRKL